MFNRCNTELDDGLTDFKLKYQLSFGRKMDESQQVFCTHYDYNSVFVRLPTWKQTLCLLAVEMQGF